jgi:hypothetical protein
VAVLTWDGGPCFNLLFGSAWKTNPNLLEGRTSGGPTQLHGGMRLEARRDQQVTGHHSLRPLSLKQEHPPRVSLPEEGGG